MSNLMKTFFTFAIVYFSMHLVYGYLHCQDNFCPGDRLTDYVYEYVDGDGNSHVVDDNVSMTQEQYRQIQKEQ